MNPDFTSAGMTIRHQRDGGASAPAENTSPSRD